MRRCSKLLMPWMLAFGLLSIVPAAWSAENPVGVPNFGQVTEAIYRGGQPSLTGFSALRHLDVGIVVNFRNDVQETSVEKRAVEALGMEYVGIPWSGRDNPSDAQIVEFLDLVRNNPHTKIFVHCQRGADRTGTMVAAYRIVVQHESVAEAVSEMRGFHYAHFWLPQLQRYVVSLPRLLHDDPLFSAYVVPSTLATDAAIVPVASPIGH